MPKKVRIGIKKGTPDEHKKGQLAWKEAAAKANRGEHLTEAEKKMLFPDQRWHSLNKFRHMWQAAPKIITALKHGSSLDMSALYAGVDPQKLKAWMAKGVASPRSYWGAFLQRIRQAVGECDVTDLSALTDAVKRGEWEAAVARLKMRGFGSDTDKGKSVEVRIVNFAEKPIRLAERSDKQIEDKTHLALVEPQGESTALVVPDRVIIRTIDAEVETT